VFSFRELIILKITVPYVCHVGATTAGRAAETVIRLGTGISF